MVDSPCECNIAANFPIDKKGIISISMRTNQEIVLIQSACGNEISLTGGTKGDLSITAYAHVIDEQPRWEGSNKKGLWCPGNAGVSFNWDQRLECNGLTTHVLPKGGARAYREGGDGVGVTENINMTTTNSYEIINASAASGPHTPYLKVAHEDGYGFTYSGEPISIDAADATGKKTISWLNPEDNPIISGDLYLMSFSWTYTPPNVPTVTYSFLIIKN